MFLSEHIPAPDTYRWFPRPAVQKSFETLAGKGGLAPENGGHLKDGEVHGYDQCPNRRAEEDHE